MSVALEYSKADMARVRLISDHLKINISRNDEISFLAPHDRNVTADMMLESLPFRLASYLWVVLFEPHLTHKNCDPGGKKYCRRGYEGGQKA